MKRSAHLCTDPVVEVVVCCAALRRKKPAAEIFDGCLLGGISVGDQLQPFVGNVGRRDIIAFFDESVEIGDLVGDIIIVCLRTAEISVDLAEAFADLFRGITFDLGSKAAADELSHPSCGDFLCKVIGKDVIGRCRAEISLFFYIREGAVGVVAPVRGGGILRRFIQCVEDLRGSHLNRGSVLFLGRLQAFLHEFLSFRHIISPVVHALHRGDHHVAGRFGSRNLIVPVVEKLFVGGAAGFRVGHPVRLIVVVKLRRNGVRRQLMFKFPCFHKESPSFQL